jgi:hypothetical protein
MEKVRDMKKHVTVVAALHIGFGFLGLIGAIALFFVFDFAQSQVYDVDVADTVLNLIKILLPIFLSIGRILSIIGGFGLLGYREWGRIIIIIMSAINCLNVPIGTAKGVYSLWALVQDDTIKLFREDYRPVTSRNN